MQQDIIRVGTIGNGFIVEEFANAIKQVDGANIEAIYLRPKDLGCGFDKKIGVEKVYSSVEKMLEDDSINCIYIAIPNVLHYFRAKQALLAGKNIIVEKPFTVNSKETQELIEIAKEKNLFIFEAMTIIHMPNYKELKKKVSQIGNICLVVANYSQYSSKYNLLMDGNIMNVFNPAFAGGCLMDLNYYNIYTTIALFGKPQKVSYSARKYKNGIDLSGIVTMEYDGFNCVCVGAKDCDGVNYFQIQGDKGYICVNDGINGVKDVNLKINGKVEYYNYQKISNRLYYELVDFVNIMRDNDYKACYELLEYTIDTLSVVSECLDQIGLHYSSSKSGNI